MAKSRVKMKGGKPVYRHTRKDKRLIGKPVVYRLSRYGIPKLGELVGRNPYPDWTIGAWIVRDDVDDRTYVVREDGGGHWRLAEKADVERYKARRRQERKASRTVERVAGWSTEVAAPKAAAPSKPKRKASETETVSTTAARQIEDELDGGDSDGT